MSFSRSDIFFESFGQLCRGWLYLPAATGPHPVIVMAHGFGAVKEMGLDAYAERLGLTPEQLRTIQERIQ